MWEACGVLQSQLSGVTASKLDLGVHPTQPGPPFTRQSMPHFRNSVREHTALPPRKKDIRTCRGTLDPFTGSSGYC